MNPQASSPRDHVPAGDAIAQAAAGWVARRDRGFSADEHAEFEAWRRADPRHAAELERLARAWQGLDRLGEVSELERMADAVVDRARHRRARRRTARVVAFAVTAAAALTVAFLGWETWGSRAAPAGSRFETGNYRVLASTAERKTLPDGTVAELNGASRIDVAFSETERRVRLVEGEAHFIVAKNPLRPFYVTAGPVTVRAVGTAFNVRLADEAIEILVTEGRVNLESAPVHPSASPAPAATAPAAVPTPVVAPLSEGQHALIALASGQPASPATIGDVGQKEIDEKLGWQSTRLVFENTPLAEAIEGFNRFNRRQLTLGDPALRRRTLSGTFRADNLEGFLRMIRFTIDVKAEQRTPAETVLLPIR